MLEKVSAGKLSGDFPMRWHAKPSNIAQYSFWGWPWVVWPEPRSGSHKNDTDPPQGPIGPITF